MSAVITPLAVPRQDVELVDGVRRASFEFRQFLLDLVQILQVTGVDPAVIADIQARIAALEAGAATATVVGIESVKTWGLLSAGLVQISLLNDVDLPGNGYFYGTGPTGVKGYFTVASTVAGADSVAKTVAGTGVSTFRLVNDVAAPGNNYYYGTSDAGAKGWFNAASNLKITALPGATYSTVQDFVNTMHSPGTIDGPTPVVVETGIPATPIRVLAGKGMIRTADDDVSSLPFFNWAQTDFAQPADGLTRFYGVVYNAGAPIVQQRTTYNWDKDTEIPLGSAVRFPSGVIVVTANPYKTGDPITNIIQRFDAQSPAIRDGSVGGLILSETGTRNSTLTAGKIWSRLSDYDSAAKNSSTTPMLSAFFNGTGLTVTSGITQWDNLNFNNMGTGSLQLMGNNKYANLWFFISIDGTKWGFAYGIAEHNSIGAAANEGVPPYLNQNFFQQALLLGRLIFQKGAATASLIESAFTSIFGTSAINNHNDLAGLQGGAVGEYYHLTLLQNTDVTTLSSGGTSAQVWRGDKVYANNVSGPWGVGTATPNFAGFTNAVTLLGSVNCAYEMCSQRADANGVLIGAFSANWRTNSAGHNRIADVQFTSDGTTANQRGGELGLYTKPDASTTLTKRWSCGQLGHFTPATDNTYNMGSAALRVREYFGAVGVINTSDRDQKDEIRYLTSQELAAASALAKAVRAYKWKTAIAEKGSANARWHIGWIAQEVRDIMIAHGLDGFAYGFLCYDEWGAYSSPRELGNDGQVIKEAVSRPAGSSYGLRKDELSAFIAAAQEQRLAALELA